MPEKTQTTSNEVRQRAYEIWEAEGRPDGRLQEFWDRAHRELGSAPDPDDNVIAVFSSETSAEAALRSLQENGVSPNRICRYSGGKGAAAYEAQDQSAGSLMDWLLGEEAPVRDESIYSSAAESQVIAVATPSTEATRIASLLQAQAPSSVKLLTQPLRLAVARE